MQWVEKGKKAELWFCTFNGLWRNLPVCLELGEEEPVGCGTSDKGDINTLTLDHWSKKRRRRFLILGLLLLCF